MEMRKIMLVKYGEVALRQGNRGYYEKQIMDDIRRRIKDLHSGNIRVFREQGRFLIEDVNGDLDTAVILLKASSRLSVKRTVDIGWASSPFSIRKAPLRVKPVICRLRALTKLV